MADPELAGRLAAAGYRVPCRLFYAGTRYAAYALPREFDGLLTECRARTGGGKGQPFNSAASSGRTRQFTVCHETGGTLLWVTVHGGVDRMPPAGDAVVIELAPTPDWTVYPYKVERVRPEQETAA
jgi:hypothetical protein